MARNDSVIRVTQRCKHLSFGFCGVMGARNEMFDNNNQSFQFITMDGNNISRNSVAAPCGLIAKSYFNGITLYSYTRYLSAV